MSYENINRLDRDSCAGCGGCRCLAAAADRANMISHVETGCLLPFFQSLITGALVGLIAAGVATWMELSNPLMLGLIAGAIGSLWWWVSSIHLWRLDTYAIPDYMQPEPEPVQATASVVRVELSDGPQLQIADLPASPAQLRDLSTGLLAGMSFSEASWSGEGRIFSRDEFRRLRDVYLQRGWVAWRNEKAQNQGIALTRTGRAVCRTLAKSE